METCDFDNSALIITSLTITGLHFTQAIIIRNNLKCNNGYNIGILIALLMLMFVLMLKYDEHFCVAILDRN